jgi:type IV secretory pathway VirB4 component
LEEVSTENERLLTSNKQLLDEKKRLLTKINELEQGLSDAANAASSWEDKFMASDAELQHLYDIQDLFVKPKSDEDGLRAETTLLRSEQANLERIVASLDQLETARLGHAEEVENLKASLSESLQKTERIKESADAELQKRMEIEDANRVTKDQLIERAAELNIKSVRNDMLQEENKSLTAKVESLELELVGLREKTNWLIISAKGDQKVGLPVLPGPSLSYQLT